MKQKIFTLLLTFLLGYSAYAQDASDFGANDVLIADFENLNPVIVDSLWTDSLKTTPITLQSANISLGENPLPIENTSATAAKYVRPAEGWRSIFIRFDKNIVLSKTPYLQVQIYPVKDKAPEKTTITVNLINDKGEVIAIGGSKNDLPYDEWSTVSIFLGKQKSSTKFNTIEIQINNGESLSKTMDTEYYIDQIGFKAPADGVELPATIFYETFGGWIDSWANGKVPGQRQLSYIDSNGVLKYEGPGEIGTAAGFASVGGFTSGVNFTFRDLAADTVSTFIARCYGMNAKYDGYSGGGRMQFRSTIPGTLESGNIDVSGFADLNLSFGIGTQEWWAYNEQIANARPKVEISVNGGNFYEIYSNSDFLLATGNFGNFEWGQPAEYEDQIFTMVEYPFTTLQGGALTGVNTINLRMSYKAGTNFWIDDMWLSAKYVGTGIHSPGSVGKLEILPNPASNYILTPNAQKVIISDLNGRVLINAENEEKVSVINLDKGIYLVKITTDGVTKAGKLVKE